MTEDEGGGWITWRCTVCNMTRVLCVIVGLMSWASTADAALCSGDFWGARTSAISPFGADQVTIFAQTTLNHSVDHGGCSGPISAQAVLVGLSANCSTSVVAQNHAQFGPGVQAVATRQCYIPHCGYLYSTGGVHIGFGDEYFEQADQSLSVNCPCEPDRVCNDGEVWSYEVCDCVDSCPLIVDTSGRGFRLTSSRDGVLFDINADGWSEQIAWTDPKRDVGFLAFDRNDNGAIDDGEELFGNVTPLPNGGGRASQGFEALASLEDPAYGPSYPDRVIDRRDAAYHRLIVWLDKNHDGAAQPDELRSAASHGLIALETKYRKAKRVDQHGNEFRLRAVSWWGSSRSSLQARLVYDVWLVVQQ